jgi:hypothetical protein
MSTHRGGSREVMHAFLKRQSADSRSSFSSYLPFDGQEEDESLSLSLSLCLNL